MSTHRSTRIGSDVLTPGGLVAIDEVKVGDKVWTDAGWASVSVSEPLPSSQIYTYTSSAGVLRVPRTTKVLSEDERVIVHTAKTINRMFGPPLKLSTVMLDPKDVIDGLVFGDGSYNKDYKKIWLCIGKQDMDYLESEVKSFIKEPMKELNKYAYLVKTSLKPEEIPYTWERDIPSRFQANPKRIAGFLRGLYSANGSVNGKRVSFKTTSKDMAYQIIELLATLGISAYFATNKPTSVKWDNGTYQSKQSYDVYTSDVIQFEKSIGFLQKYKQEKLSKLVSDFNADKSYSKKSYEVDSEKRAKVQTAMKIVVDSPQHVYWLSGFAVCDNSEE